MCSPYSEMYNGIKGQERRCIRVRSAGFVHQEEMKNCDGFIYEKGKKNRSDLYIIQLKERTKPHWICTWVENVMDFKNPQVSTIDYAGIQVWIGNSIPHKNPYPQPWIQVWLDFKLCLKSPETASSALKIYPPQPTITPKNTSRNSKRGVIDGTSIYSSQIKYVSPLKSTINSTVRSESDTGDQTPSKTSVYACFQG